MVFLWIAAVAEWAKNNIPAVENGQDQRRLLPEFGGERKEVVAKPFKFIAPQDVELVLDTQISADLNLQG